MSTHIRNALEAVVVAAMAILLAHCTSGCIPAASPAEAETTYTAELAACVEKNDTKATIDACRAEVDVKWGVCVKPDGTKGKC